jgi:hypothetical protein
MSVAFSYGCAERHYAECHYADRRYAECQYTGCRGALNNQEWGTIGIPCVLFVHFQSRSLPFRAKPKDTWIFWSDIAKNYIFVLAAQRFIHSVNIFRPRQIL